MRGPDSFIDRYFWKRDKKRVIRDILREYPQFADMDEDSLFDHYLYIAIQAHQQFEQLSTMAAGGEIRQIEVPELLARALSVWSAGASKLHYVYVFLQQLMEVQRLESTLKANQDREEKITSLATLTAKVAQTVTGIIDPNNRSN